jgi:hypothetical protein
LLLYLNFSALCPAMYNVHIFVWNLLFVHISHRGFLSERIESIRNIKKILLYICTMFDNSGTSLLMSRRSDQKDTWLHGVFQRFPTHKCRYYTYMCLNIHYILGWIPGYRTSFQKSLSSFAVRVHGWSWRMLTLAVLFISWFHVFVACYVQGFMLLYDEN